MGKPAFINAVSLCVLLSVAGLGVGFPTEEPAAVPCSPVQMDSGGSMDKIPVLDQDRVGACYAYAGTQLYMAYRFAKDKRKPEHITSAMAAGFGSGLKLGKKRLGAGYSCDVVNYLRDNGSCDRRKVIEKVPSLPKYLPNHYQETLLSVYFDYQTVRATSALGEKKFDFRDGVAGRLAACLREMGAPSEVLPSVERLSALLDEEQSLNFLRGILAQECSEDKLEKFELPAFECKTDNVIKVSSEDIVKQVNGRLDLKDPMPIAFTHCTELLQKDEEPPQGVDHVAGKLTEACDASKHVAVVIGRRPDPNDPKKCQFRVRNEWGTDCDGYYSDLWDCDNGNLWIDTKAFGDNTYSLQYLVELPAK